MPQINLLPWREELRNRRNKEFGVIVGIGIALMLGVWGGVHVHYQERIDFQNARNAYLEGEIGKLNKKIKEIEDLDREKERLLARMQIIQQLQSSRPEIVHLFDALVKTLPEGVYYTRVEQKGSNLTLVGVAQSNARVSSLMRALEDSEWLENPALIEITAQTRKTATQELRLSGFSLKVKQQAPKKPDEEGKS